MNKSTRRPRALILLAVLAAATVAPVRPAAARLFGPCEPHTASVAGTAVSVPSAVAERGIDDWICALEDRVLADIANDRGIVLDAPAAAEIVAHGRDEVRTRLFVKLIQAVHTAPGSRDAVQQGAVSWLVERVREVRVAQATRALEQFRLWETERCAYVPPAGFTYTPGPGQCGGTLTSLFSGGPLPPSYEELARYGVVLAFDELGGGVVAANLANLSRDITTYIAGVAVGSGTVLAGVAGAAIVNTSTALAELIFASLGTAGLPAGATNVAAGSVGFGSVVAGPAAIVLTGVVISVVRGVQVFEAADIGPRLEDDLLAAGLTDEAALVSLLSSEDGMSVALLAFAAQTSTDSPVPAALASPTSPPTGAPVLRTVHGDLELSPDPVITFRASGGSRNRAWLDRNWWVVDRGADGGPTEVLPVLPLLAPNGSARFVRFTGEEFLVSAFNDNGSFSCPGAGCVATPVFDYLAPDGAGTLVASTGFAGLPPQSDFGPTVVGLPWEGSRVALEIDAYDPAGGPVRADWLVESQDGLGGTATWRGRGTTVAYEITRPGAHTVTVRVTNELGLSSSFSTGFSAIATLSSQLTLTAQTPPTECSPVGNVIAQVDPDLLALGQTLFVQLDVDDDGTYEAVSTTDSSGRALLPIFTPLSRGPHLLRAQTRSFTTGQIFEETRELLVVENAPPGPTEIELRYPDGSWGPPPVIDPVPADLGLPHFEEGEEILVRARVDDPCSDPVDLYVVWGSSVAALQQIDVLEGAEPGVWHEFSHVFAGDFFPAFFPAVFAAGMDADGAVSTEFDGAYFIVDNVAPTIDAPVVATRPGHHVTLRARTGDAAGVHEVEEVVIEWGDGTESDVEIDPESPAGQLATTVVASHQYASAGPRTVTVRATDNAATTTRSLVVDVPGLAPAITILDLQSALDSRIVVGVDDPDGNAMAATVEIDWGDGSPATTASYDAASGGFAGFHSYAYAGTYRLVVRAIDESDIAAPDLIGFLQVASDPTALLQLHIDRVHLATPRGRRADSGFLTLRARMSDSSGEDTLFDEVLAGDFEMAVSDSDGSFDVTVPLADCRLRGTRRLVCPETPARRTRVTLVRHTRGDSASRLFSLRVSARRLQEDVTGAYVPEAPTLDGPARVLLRRGVGGALAAADHCGRPNSAALACRQAD